jgi:hypothetical protein
MQHPQSHQEPPVIYGSTSGFGKAAGAIVAVLGTPSLYEVTRPPLFRYLARMYGRDLAEWLCWGAAIAEAAAIYYVVLAVAFGLSYLLAWLAARGLSR